MNYTNSRVYFYIKNPISNSFNQFNSVLDWASIPGKYRGLGAKGLKTQSPADRTAGYFLRSVGSL